MKHMRNAALTGIIALVAAVLTAPSAGAAGTLITSGSLGGTAYTGGVTGSLLGTATVSTSLGNGTCTTSSLTGSVNSDGTGLTISAATFGGTGTGGSCTGSGSEYAVITALSLPWSGGSVVYNSSGNPDANVTLSGASVQAVVHNVPLIGTLTCSYSGSLTANGYNPNNTHRPDTTTAKAQIYINGASITKSGGSVLCPSKATVTGNYGITTSGGASLWIQSS